MTRGNEETAGRAQRKTRKAAQATDPGWIKDVEYVCSLSSWMYSHISMTPSVHSLPPPSSLSHSHGHRALRYSIPVLTQLRDFGRRSVNPGRFLQCLLPLGPAAPREHNQSKAITWLSWASQNRNAPYCMWHPSSARWPPRAPCPCSSAPQPEGRLGSVNLPFCCRGCISTIISKGQVFPPQFLKPPPSLLASPRLSYCASMWHRQSWRPPNYDFCLFDSSVIPRQDLEVQVEV